MHRVYLETTVVGHLAGRLHPDPVISARQLITRRWWAWAQPRFRLFASGLVIDECGEGDPVAADERLAVLSGIELLDLDLEAEQLAKLLMVKGAVPSTQPRDATHLAAAAVNGIEFLATWNFKHIMNPSTQHLIDLVCRDAGYRPSSVCTPEQLLESWRDS